MTVRLIVQYDPEQGGHCADGQLNTKVEGMLAHIANGEPDEEPHYITVGQADLVLGLRCAVAEGRLPIEHVEFRNAAGEALHINQYGSFTNSNEAIYNSVPADWAQRLLLAASRTRKKSRARHLPPAHYYDEV